MDKINKKIIQAVVSYDLTFFLPLEWFFSSLYNPLFGLISHLFGVFSIFCLFLPRSFHFFPALFFPSPLIQLRMIQKHVRLFEVRND